MLSPGTFPRTNWDVDPSGGGFLLVKGQRLTPGDEGLAPVMELELVVNWFEELKERVGEGG